MATLYSQGFIYNSIIKDSLYYEYDEYGELFFNANSDCYYSENPNEPSLPLYTIYVNVLENDEFSHFTYEFLVDSVLFDIHIAPNAEVFCPTDSVYEQRHNINYLNDKYPVDVISFIGECIERDNKKLAFEFSPFVYIESDSILLSVSSLTITINFKDGNSIVKKYNNENDVYLDGDSNLDYVNVGQTIESFNSLDSVEYLIITSSELSESFKPLSDWKTLKGIPALIVSTDSIYRKYTDFSNEIKIKKYINELYYKTNKRLRYVLLGGDETVVPVKYCRVAKISTNGDTIRMANVPTDIFYGCFDGNFVWDANNDGISGDVNKDSIDYYPEVFVSRFPARTVEHVEAMVEKSLNYEKNPPLKDWYYNVLMTGAKISINKDAERRSDTICKYTFNKYLENPYIFKLFDSYTSYPEGADYGMTPDNLQKELAKGYHFVNEFTHGQICYWSINVKDSDYFYRTEHALSLSSDKPMHILTIACHTNSFHLGEPCLGEAFMRNKNNNVVSYLGSSSYGWLSSGWRTLGASPQLINNFYELLLSDSNKYCNYAELVTNAKLKLKNYHKNFSEHWVFFSVNAMGDPELPIYNRVPKEFNNISYALTDKGIVLKIHESNTRVTVCGYDENGKMNYSILKNVSDSCIIENISNLLNITLCKPNYVPYTLNLSISKIQNKIFTGVNDLNGNKIDIGYNITDSISHGDVIIRNGKTIINSGSRVFIKNGFKVKNGSKLYIK